MQVSAIQAGGRHIPCRWHKPPERMPNI